MAGGLGSSPVRAMRSAAIGGSIATRLCNSRPPTASAGRGRQRRLHAKRQPAATGQYDGLDFRHLPAIRTDRIPAILDLSRGIERKTGITPVAIKEEHQCARRPGACPDAWDYSNKRRLRVQTNENLTLACDWGRLYRVSAQPLTDARTNPSSAAMGRSALALLIWVKLRSAFS